MSTLYHPKHLQSGYNLPKMCHDLEENDASFVYTWIWETYLIIAGIAAIYFISAIYFYAQRNKVSFLTRSPITVCISLTMLGCDSILNTFIFSEITWGNPFHFNCNMGVAATVFG